MPVTVDTRTDEEGVVEEVVEEEEEEVRGAVEVEDGED